MGCGACLTTCPGGLDCGPVTMVPDNCGGTLSCGGQTTVPGSCGGALEASCHGNFCEYSTASCNGATPAGPVTSYGGEEVQGTDGNTYLCTATGFVPEASGYTQQSQGCSDAPDAVSVAAGATNQLIDSGFTTSYADTANQDCGLDGTVGTGASDRMYVVTPAASGTLTVTIGNDTDNATAYCTEQGGTTPTVKCWQYALYARTVCTDEATSVACTQPTFGSLATISFAVTAGTPYYVFVDGLQGDAFSYGYYNLFATLQ
jgi:hypothetical protein